LRTSGLAGRFSVLHKHKIAALVTGVFNDVVFRNLLGAASDVLFDMIVKQLFAGKLSSGR